MKLMTDARNCITFTSILRFFTALLFVSRITSQVSNSSIVQVLDRLPYQEKGDAKCGLYSLYQYKSFAPGTC